MKKTICTMLAVILILTVCMIPSFAQVWSFREYKGATINVIHCGYNRDWEDDPRQPLAVVEIETSGSEWHQSWTAIYIPSLMTYWDEESGGEGYTSGHRHEYIAYGYPSGLQTDYCAKYPG